MRERLRIPLGVVCLLGALVLFGASAKPDLPWSGWYNLPKTSVDVRYRNGADVTAQDHRSITWEFRNRHSFPVSFEYEVKFQLYNRDWMVKGRHNLQPGTSSEQRTTTAMQILNVRLMHVVRESP